MSNKTITFGGGCFWCTEAIFNQMKGIEKVVAGYAGGNVPGHPTYKEVCSGLTGHAEVVEITYNPKEISLEEVLIIFMTTHDPTTLNRQGGDVGTQYRSIIFYGNDTEKEIINKVVSESQVYFDDPIVTEIVEKPTFYRAEDYHQNYYANNTQQGYCNAVISPKLAKARKLYADKLK